MNQWWELITDIGTVPMRQVTYFTFLIIIRLVILVTMTSDLQCDWTQFTIIHSHDRYM